ncbi:hypothetical protein BG74_02650 [Sodalis-like endosymbiont of Proechinophthirus fluctus]|uniref:hypothetical protein n=1 Tax=Sodalis-like endosymbiont of Proechinophthirus fluctus TaxID=1462730 RepID=UPI0007A84EA9|nr:hypothetical protein [Sodalis-like endosymbiont of Proechinophthirus fluctus]KYP97441.1 hypothetical protein BG74_02650 [Sodalis-like endosymbiont of Proechinophthirus fluctus]
MAAHTALEMHIVVMIIFMGPIRVRNEVYRAGRKMAPGVQELPSVSGEGNTLPGVRGELVIFLTLLDL